MNLPGPELPKFHLQPGQLLVTHEPQWVVTLLGSCVAVTMFNARFCLAAVCHAMLPKPHPRNLQDLDPGDYHRYVSLVIPAMVEPFARLGLKPAEVEVKMFGGGNVLDLGGDPNAGRLIGDANIALARQLLQHGHFQIKGENAGGNRGCKIVFNTQSGEVLHKRLSRIGRRL